MKLPIYMDYASTTPVDPKIAKKMMNYLTKDGIFGNPSSNYHHYGWKASESIDISRDLVAQLINAQPKEIIFTSGATESNNLAIKGIAYANKKKGNHIITSVIEHKSVINTCNYLEKKKFKITKLIPNHNGIITPQQIQQAITNKTILVSLMHVNNELGTINDIYQFGNICKKYNIPFHVDATQSVGKIPINIEKMPITLMSFSGHKMYGPKGIGVLYIKKKNQIKIEPQIHGGGQELGLRSGTLAVHQIIGIGEACKIAKKNMNKEIEFLNKLHNQLYQGLKKIKNIKFNGDLSNKITTILNVSFKDINIEILIAALKDIAISSKSACISSNINESSYVLQAIGLNKQLSYNSIRLSIGRFTTMEEIKYTTKHIYQLTKLIKS